MRGGDRDSAMIRVLSSAVPRIDRDPTRDLKVEIVEEEIIGDGVVAARVP